MALDDLKKEPMMAYLIDALAAKTDIGHYGRLTFIMIGRHFLTEDELVEQLIQAPDCDEAKARGMIQQVVDRNYNPPRRERIIEWNGRQEFPICPNPDDPDACNVYKHLEFPNQTYEHISEYHEKTEAAH
jgi:hypothetical protein